MQGMSIANKDIIMHINGHYYKVTCKILPSDGIWYDFDYEHNYAIVQNPIWNSVYKPSHENTQFMVNYLVNCDANGNTPAPIYPFHLSDRDVKEDFRKQVLEKLPTNNHDYLCKEQYNHMLNRIQELKSQSWKYGQPNF